MTFTLDGLAIILLFSFFIFIFLSGVVPQDKNILTRPEEDVVVVESRRVLNDSELEWYAARIPTWFKTAPCCRVLEGDYIPAYCDCYELYTPTTTTLMYRVKP